jgi:hypothetical protein
MIIFEIKVFCSFFHHVGFEDTKGMNFFIFQGPMELCFLGLVQTTSIPLKNLELIVSLLWTSQRPKWGTILPPEYFTLGRCMANSLTGMFLSFNVGRFTWVPFSIYEVVTYITHCYFYSISSVKGGTVIPLWFSPQSLVCMNRLHHE